MKDDAVSVVIGYMVLLVITVSFIALLNAIWIPQMKQQAEVEHLNQVQDSFLSFATDIDHLTAYRQNSTITHRVQLGGGDVLFSPVKSFGTLQTEVYCGNDEYLQLCNSTSCSRINISNVTLSYLPNSNFWVNQGYVWENGTIFVTKSSKRTTLDLYDDSDLFTSQKLKPSVESVTGYGSYTNVTISTVTFSTTQNMSVSGNGIGSIRCEMNCPIERVFSIVGKSGISGNWMDELDQNLLHSGVQHSYENYNITFDKNVTAHVKNCSVTIGLQ